MNDVQRIGLYYPYLHFSDSWLKVAALYWPRMGRIAPREVRLADSATVRALADELNFTMNVEPGLAAEELTSILANAVEDHFDELRHRYSIPADFIMRSNWCGPSWDIERPVARDWRAWNPDELTAAGEVVRLHTAKGSEHLWNILSDAGLAVRSGAWWALHAELAWLYMCALADKLARQNMLTPTTDQAIAHLESLSWTDGLFVSTLLEHDPSRKIMPHGEYKERIALLALKLVIPENLQDVSVQKIIKIRQRYAADFDAFYGEVSDLARSMRDELSQIENPEVLAAYVESEAQRRFRQPMANLQKEMKGQGVDATVTALTTKFELPSSAMIAGGLLTHHPVVAAGGRNGTRDRPFHSQFPDRSSQSDPLGG